MKHVVRFSAILVITVTTILIILGLSGLLIRIEQWQNAYPILRVMIGFLGVLTTIAIFTLWVAMVYDWGVSEFSTSAQRLFWCFLLTVFNVLGAIMYYFVVYQRRQQKTSGS